MSESAPTKLRAANWSEIRPKLQLAGPSAQAVADAQDAPAALAALEQADLLSDAAKLLAFALPKREAVWWACMCARHTVVAELPQPDRLALEAAEAWVFKSDDQIRRDAFTHAEASGFGTPEAWAAVAAFWSGDSVAPVGQGPVPPPPYISCTAVSGSVALAAVRGKPERRDARLKRFLASGRAIAEGAAGRLPPEEA